MPHDVDIVREWLTKSGNDLESARRLIAGDDPILETACFHCQQTVEKALKGLLRWHGQEPPRIRMLIPLFDLYKAYSTAIYELRGECAWLTAFAVEVRHPSAAGPPTPEHAREALEAGENLFNAVQRSLPAEIHP